MKKILFAAAASSAILLAGCGQKAEEAAPAEAAAPAADAAAPAADASAPAADAAAADAPAAAATDAGTSGGVDPAAAKAE